MNRQQPPFLSAILKAALHVLVGFVLCSLEPKLLGQTAPVITQDLTNENVITNGVVTFSVGVSGTPPFSYRWQLNGAALPDLITTAAGNGKGVFAGDNGPAANASLYGPADVSFDAAGNLFIADFYNNRIRRMNTNGTITTVAGSGAIGGYFGDGGPAVNAGLYWPAGVLADSIGDLFIADFNNNRVRKVDTNGIITTLAGNGNAGYTGDGGSATNAELDGPWGLVLDAAGNLIFSDCYNNVIRRVDINGIISTIVGNGLQDFAGDGMTATNASLNDPSGLCLDNGGNLFFADYGNNRIREVNTNGIITTVVGGGVAGLGDGAQATNALLSEPSKVVMDSAGNLLIADTDNNRIRKVETNGIITTIAGTGTNAFSSDGDFATNASLNQPWGLAVDASDNVWIADTDNERVRKVFGNNSSVLVLPDLGTNRDGSYSVVVSNPYGSAASMTAILMVWFPPSLSSQPQSVTAKAGSGVSFSVGVEGTPPFAYQWTFNGAAMPGQTNSTLTFSRVSAAGAGGYRVVVTNDVGLVTSSVATLTVWPLTAFIPVWKPTSAPNLNWTSVACSADGATDAAIASGILYLSTNFGETWTSNNSGLVWLSIAVSPDGTNLAGVEGSEQEYVSTNAGASWEASSNAYRMYSVGFSADGTHLVAFGDGYYLSTNFGATWTYSSGQSGNLFAVSGNGEDILLYNGVDLKVSTNYGAAWSAGIYAGDLGVLSVTCSADGTRMTACEQDLELSTNGGATWTESSLGPRAFFDAASVDGSRIVAVTAGRNDALFINTSPDFGATWISNICPSLEWSSVAYSQDGTRLVAVAYSSSGYTGSTIYTAQWPPDLTITPMGGSILLSWPAPSVGFVLQENTDSTLTNWAPVPIAPVTTNYQNQVTIPASSNALFFRLAGPAF